MLPYFIAPLPSLRPVHWRLVTFFGQTFTGRITADILASFGVGIWAAFESAPARAASLPGAVDDIAWSLGKPQNAFKNAKIHWEKHGNEFPGINSMDDYIQHANKFVSDPPAGTLSKARLNGDTLYYEPKTNTFAVKEASGAPRTMFKPDDGINYFNKQ